MTPALENPKSQIPNTTSPLCLVSVHAPLGRKLFLYECPPELGSVTPGDAVLVPFGGREMIGWVVRSHVSADDVDAPTGRTVDPKPILERIAGAALSAEDLNLCETLHSYYGTNLSDILALFVPPSAPKIVRAMERVSAGAFDEALLPEVDRHIAKLVAEAGGAMDIRKIQAASKHYPSSIFKSALRRLMAGGHFKIHTSVVSVRPGQKKFLGPAETDPASKARPELTGVQEKIMNLAKQHPFRFGAAELARLAQALVSDVQSLIRNRLVTERVGRIWRTPMERDKHINIGLTPDAPDADAPGLRATPSQSRAILQVIASIDARAPDLYLLCGPTASGKTFVYEAAARHALALGRQVLLMVPEIALTKPLIERIRSSISAPIAVVHSRQTKAERRDEWQRCAAGVARLLVGPRSAAFVPLPEFGLAVVDECHDPGYKQSESPYLDARKVVEEKCKRFKAPLLLGSATPTVEQLYSADRQIYNRMDLTEFPTRRRRPDVTVVDLRVQHAHDNKHINIGLTPCAPCAPDAGPDAGASMFRRCFLTPELQTMIEETLSRRQAAILMLNRRGFAPAILCLACGYSSRCDACLLGMTYHAQDRRMICHGCGRMEIPPDVCPGCGYTPLGYMGAGTERLAEACEKRFVGAKVGRLDQDIFRKDRRHAFGVLEDLKNGRLDILVGTQMIAKGLDIPRVTLAAVVFADTGLSLPDFRCRERAFQLMTQLIGRAGRHKDSGRAVVQTFQPALPAVVFSLTEDVQSFYANELEIRRQGAWPPYARIVRIVIQSSNAPKALQVARQVHGYLEAFFAPEMPPGAGKPALPQLTSPSPAPRPKMNGEYRFQMLLRLPPGADIPTGLAEEVSGKFRQASVKVVVEPDPISVL